MTMQQSDMERYNPLLMLKEVMAQTPYRHKRWGERKFRYKFVLRCLINPVTTIKYFNELCHLNQPRTLIIHRPLLPAKIQRPYLYTGLGIRCRARAILEHYQFVQSFPENKIKKSSCPRSKPYSLTWKEKTVRWWISTAVPVAMTGKVN